jgi:aminoglycoside N3'-acetyltransferase
MTGVPLVRQLDIEEGLRSLGLTQGDAVEVHSSLSAFGWVEGGAGAVVDALMRVVGQQGTLIMSAYLVGPAIPLTDEEQARGITWKVKMLTETDERRGLGAVVEVFRHRPEIVCGTGMHQVCVWGQDAELHKNGYQHLLEIDGRVLLLGVGINRCSSLHQAEDVPLPEQIMGYFRVPDDIRREYEAKGFAIGYSGRELDDAWEKVFVEAGRRGLVRRHQIGQAICYLFNARAMVNIYREWRRTDPFSLFGVTQGA